MSAWVPRLITALLNSRRPLIKSILLDYVEADKVFKTFGTIVLVNRQLQVNGSSRASPNFSAELTNSTGSFGGDSYVLFRGLARLCYNHL